MVERHGPGEGKEISNYKMKLFNSTHARVLLKMIPKFGEEFQHFNLSYLAKILNIHYSYLQEVLDFLCDKDIIEFDGEDFFISQDNIWKIQDTLNRQALIILKNKVDSYEGTNDFKG